MNRRTLGSSAREKKDLIDINIYGVVGAERTII